MDASIDQILGLIDREVEEARQNVEHGGWTSWVVLAAMASLFWLGTDVVQSPVKITIVESLALGLVFSLEFLSSFASIFEAQPLRRGGNSRFVLGSALGSMRTSMLILVARQVLVAVMLISTWRVAIVPGAYTGMLVVGFVAITSILMILFTFTDLPFSRDPHEPVRFAATGWLIVMAILSVVTVICYLNKSTLAAATVADWRLAGIAFGAYFLLPRIGSHGRERALIIELQEIRRAIVLDGISVENAHMRTQIALLGIGATGVLQNGVQRLSDLYQLQSDECERLDRKHLRVRSLLTLIEDGDSAARGLVNEARSCLVDTDQSFVHLERNEIQIQKAIKRIKRQAMLVSRFSREAEGEVVALLSELVPGAASVSARVKACIEKDKALKSELTQADQAVFPER
jgi:hypothetical protein